MTRKSFKCNAPKGKWCEAIKLTAHQDGGNATGLGVVEVMNRDTKKKGFGMYIRFQRARKKVLGGTFIWLNYCPFCGTNVEEHIK